MLPVGEVLIDGATDSFQYARAVDEQIESAGPRNNLGEQPADLIFARNVAADLLA